MLYLQYFLFTEMSASIKSNVVKCTSESFCVIIIIIAR